MKPKGHFKGAASIEWGVVKFTLGEKVIEFIPYERSPLINLQTDMRGDHAFIGSEERYDELWKILLDLINKWNDEV